LTGIIAAARPFAQIEGRSAPPVRLSPDTTA